MFNNEGHNIIESSREHAGLLKNDGNYERRRGTKFM
jgi:hypothetical protein